MRQLKLPIVWDYVTVEDCVDAWMYTRNLSTTIDSLDKLVFDLELEALAFTYRNGFQPSVQQIQVKHVYYTSTGEKIVRTEIGYKQDKKWIKNYIQQRLRSYSIRLTHSDIGLILDDVTKAHAASEAQGKDIHIKSSRTLRHRIAA